MDKVIKIALSILFIICLANLPYGYYQLVRFFALCGFSLLAYNAYKNDLKYETIIYLFLAILFQPLFKISLGRDIWNVVDIIVALGLLVSVFINSNQPKK